MKQNYFPNFPVKYTVLTYGTYGRRSIINCFNITILLAFFGQGTPKLQITSYYCI